MQRVVGGSHSEPFTSIEGKPRSGVKNPENICLIIATITLWILRCTQDDERYFLITVSVNSLALRGQGDSKLSHSQDQDESKKYPSRQAVQ